MQPTPSDTAALLIHKRLLCVIIHSGFIWSDLLKRLHRGISAGIFRYSKSGDVVFSRVKCTEDCYLTFILSGGSVENKTFIQGTE